MDKHSSLSGGDVLILLKIAAHRDEIFSTRKLEAELGLKKSSVANALLRLEDVGLIRRENKRPRVDRIAARDCLQHGVRWLVPARVGDWELGLPTAHSASPLKGKLRGDDDPVVIPLAHGPMRGRAIAPIHERAPDAAKRDPRLYELLTLVDAFRVGRPRDREIAARELALRL